MVLYIGFLKNAVTQDEFVAPAEALNREQAVQQLQGAYPEPVYHLLTVYGRHELIHILATMERWPGMPSKAQPPLDELLAHVQARQADSGHVVRDDRPLPRPAVQALAARLVERTPAPPMPEPENALLEEPRISRHASEALSPPEPLIEKPRSLIEALKGIRH